MADDPSNNDNLEPNDDGEESFAEMFESYSAGMKEDLNVGDKVRGRIIAITDSAVFVDTGTKADGVVEIEELKDDEGNLPHAVGDYLELYVVAADESEIRLSRAIAGVGGLDLLKDAYAGAIPVEGKVLQVIKGGVPGGGAPAPRVLPHQPDRYPLRGNTGNLCGPELPVSHKKADRKRAQYRPVPTRPAGGRTEEGAPGFHAGNRRRPGVYRAGHAPDAIRGLRGAYPGPGRGWCTFQS
jgi:hypothetical protein